MAKVFEDQLLAFALIGVAATIAGGVGLAWTGMPAAGAIGFVLVSTVIHIAYEYGLLSSYRLGAFNQTYPIARGTSPLVVAFGAWFLAGEHLAPIAWAGILTLAVGLVSLAFSAGRITRAELPAVSAAVATGLTIAGYTIVDGLGVRRSHDAYAYAALLFLLQGPVFPAIVLARRHFKWPTASQVSRGLLAGWLSRCGLRGSVVGADASTARGGGGTPRNECRLRGDNRCRRPQGAFRRATCGGGVSGRRRDTADRGLSVAASYLGSGGGGPPDPGLPPPDPDPRPGDPPAAPLAPLLPLLPPAASRTFFNICDAPIRPTDS
jgi:hypothetical protein